MIRALRSPDRAALVIAVFVRVCTGWLLATRPTDLNVGDPGQWIDAGDRMLRGEWPYRDWTGIYGPLLYVWGTFWYWLLGADWRAALLMLEVVSPVVCLLLAYATVRLTLPTPGWRARFIAAVALLGLDAFYWSPGIRIWVPVAALAWAARPPAGRWSWLPFAACGLTPLLSPDTGLPCLLAALLLPGRSGWRGRAGILLPLPAAWLIAPHAIGEWVTATGRLTATASWIWGVPFPGDLFRFRRLTFLLPLAFTLAAAVRLGWSMRRASGTERSRILVDAGLLLLAAGCLRSLLGRTDTAHLLFVLPPFLLVGCRFAASSGRFGSMTLTVLLIPFLWFSAVEGPVRRATDGWRSIGVERGIVPGDRVALPKAFAAHLDRVTGSARPLLSSDDSVLSLPLPIYAHLLRRPNALPVAVPELLTRPTTGAAPRVVIVDPTLALAWDSYFLAPTGGPLTWSTPADEPITRDLRELLRRNYAPHAEIDGARILVRRKAALPPRGERIIMTITPADGDTDAVTRGDAMTLEAHGAICDEIRTRVTLRFGPGLAGLAKAYTRVTAVERSGRVHEMVQPLPPAHLGIELRWPVPRAPLARILIDAGTPGTFNPDPRSATVDPVRLIRYVN